MKVSYKKFSKFGRVPIRATSGSACFDVYSSCEARLRPGETKAIDLEIGFSFSKKYCCRSYPKSDLSLLPIFLAGGIVDSDYRGKKQESLSQTLLETYPSDINLQICLMFIRMICDWEFGDYFARLISGRVISEEEITVFFAEKLDSFLEEQTAEVSNER